MAVSAEPPGDAPARSRPRLPRPPKPSLPRLGSLPQGAPQRALARARPFAPGVVAVLGGAALLRVIAGVGFVNYDTLYALVWGRELAGAHVPQYGVAIAPTPHPLLELLGLVLSPLSAGATAGVTVWLAFIALAACGWVTYRLGQLWFGPLAGALAALILITRVPLLSYGSRAYADVPYLLLVLCALLIESRRRRAGWPVLALLGLAGLLRPEAWAFAGLYWLYLAIADRRRRSVLELSGLLLVALAAPIVWVLSDWLITGHPLWSLTSTRHTAHELARKTGIGNVPQYIPRRIGEILRPPVLAGAALGGVLSLIFLRPRAALGAIAGIVAVAVFAALAAAGMPIDTRYAFLAAAILCLFCGAGVFGWLARDDLPPRVRAGWIAAGAAVLLALLVALPGQYRSAHRELSNLSQQQTIQDELTALVGRRAITLRCGPVGVPNHAPIPLLALYLDAPPSRIVNGQLGLIRHGTYLDPASRQVEERYVLDPRDPHVPVAIPPGFRATQTTHSWIVFTRCV